MATECGNIGGGNIKLGGGGGGGKGCLMINLKNMLYQIWEIILNMLSKRFLTKTNKRRLEAIQGWNPTNISVYHTFAVVQGSYGSHLLISFGYFRVTECIYIAWFVG